MSLFGHCSFRMLYYHQFIKSYTPLPFLFAVCRLHRCHLYWTSRRHYFMVCHETTGKQPIHIDPRAHVGFTYEDNDKDNQLYLFDHKTYVTIFYIFHISITIVVEETTVKYENHIHAYTGTHTKRNKHTQTHAHTDIIMYEYSHTHRHTHKDTRTKENKHIHTRTHTRTHEP